MVDLISVVVTGAGAPGIVGTIYSLRHNPDNRRFKIISTDIRDNVVGKYLSDSFYRVPPAESPDYVEVMKSIVIKEKALVILPQTTREVEALSKNLNEFDRIGVKVVVSGYDTIKIANDKFLLLEKAKELGIPYPLYYLVSSEKELLEALNSLNYPSNKVVVKPRISNGMRGLRILTEDSWDVERFLSEKPEGIEINLNNLLSILRNGIFPELLVMEYLNGEEYTVDVFRNNSGIIAIPRLRSAIRSGITFEALVDLREDLIVYSEKLADALGLRYCFGFQFKFSKEGIPKLLECNPRIQGSMVVSKFANFNMIYYSVMEALGCKIDLKEVHIYNGIRFVRYWGGIAELHGNFIGRI
ncbi:MAG: ATP-grasp domain-containing protein [Candidatus Micrarchaeia archaeon]